MNIRELEALLRRLKGLVPQEYTATHDDIHSAIRYCERQQKATAKRKAEYKLRAAERRESLR